MLILAGESFIEALVEYSFLRQALITGIIMGLVAPIIGSFVIIRRLSFIADTLSHFNWAISNQHYWTYIYWRSNLHRDGLQCYWSINH